MAVERVEGVREATFSYAKGDGFVTYDRTATSPDEFIAELERLTEFTATVREDAEASEEEHGAGRGTEPQNDQEAGAGNRP